MDSEQRKIAAEKQREEALRLNAEKAQHPDERLKRAERKQVRRGRENGTNSGTKTPHIEKTIKSRARR